MVAIINCLHLLQTLRLVLSTSRADSSAIEEFQDVQRHRDDGGLPLEERGTILESDEQLVQPGGRTRLARVGCNGAIEKRSKA